MWGIPEISFSAYLSMKVFCWYIYNAKLWHLLATDSYFLNPFFFLLIYFFSYLQCMKSSKNLLGKQGLNWKETCINK